MNIANQVFPGLALLGSTDVDPVRSVHQTPAPPWTSAKPDVLDGNLMSLPPYYPTPTPPMVTHGTELPQWAKGFRTTLLVCHALGMVGVAVFLFALMVPTEPGMGGTAQKAWALLFLWIWFMITAIPYAIANIVYGILWLSSLRGKSHRVNKFSTVFLLAPPLIISATVIGWIFQAFGSR